MKQVNRLRWCAAAALAGMALVSAVWAERPSSAPSKVVGTSGGGTEKADASKLLAVPEAAAQAEALKLVKDVFKDDLSKAKKPAEKTALAAKLLQAGKDEQKDPAGRYVLFNLAKEMASEVGDLETACNAIDEMDGSYKIDALNMKASAATAVSKVIHTADDRKAFAAKVDPLTTQAVNAERFDLARQLNDLALAAARGSNDLAQIRQDMTRVQQIRDAEVASAACKKALVVLADKPKDAEANLIVGKFRCFGAGDWTTGLPNLALGTDAALKALAEKEIAGVTAAEDQVKLGDAWWDAAQTMPATAKSTVQLHAASYYSQALPELGKGLLQAKLSQRVKSAGEDPVARTVASNTTGAAASSVDPITATEINWNIIYAQSAAIDSKSDKPIPLKKTDQARGWTQVPESLEKHGSMIYFEHVSGEGSAAGGVAEFEVTRGGYLLLACHFGGEGNSSGEWTKTRLTEEGFVALGWRVLSDKLMGGPLQKDGEGGRRQVVLCKKVAKGEKYSLRSNKYDPPYAIVFEK